MPSFGSLAIARPLHDFVETALTPDSGVTPAEFWAALEAVLIEMSPRNAALLARRDVIESNESSQGESYVVLGLVSCHRVRVAELEIRSESINLRQLVTTCRGCCTATPRKVL